MFIILSPICQDTLFCCRAKARFSICPSLQEKPERPAGESYFEKKIFNCKGHKAERDRPDRQAIIAANMADMPAQIEAYRKERHEKRQKTELQKILDWKKRK